MIIAQVCLRRAAVKGHSKMCSFITQHNATDVVSFKGACNWHADCRNDHQSCSPWIECSFPYHKPSPKAFQRIWLYIQQSASQPQTMCNHTSPGPPHPASSPPRSSETSHPDSCCNNRFITTNRENLNLMRIVKQNRFKNLGELHKEWTEAGVKASRATTRRRVKQFGYSCRQRRLTWAKEKKNWTVAQWSKFLFSDESKFCIFCIRKGGEAHSPSSVLSFHSLWWFGVQCHLLVLVHCVLKTNITAPVYQEILEHFMLPSADQLFKNADLIFQQHLAPAHTAKSTKSWLMTMVLVCLTGQQTHQTWTL